MRAKPITRFTEVGGDQIAFQIVGDGDRDLLWFWGLSNLDLQWTEPPIARALERLSRYGRLLLFDRRGTGISDHLSSGQLPTWEDWAEDVTAVLDAAGSKQAAICAVGDGGPLGILFAALHPERVNALVLHNTTARYLVADDYPIGRSAATVERLLGGFEQLWGTEDWARVVEGREGEEALRWVAAFTRGIAPQRESPVAVPVDGHGCPVGFAPGAGANARSPRLRSHFPGVTRAVHRRSDTECRVPGDHSSR